MATVFKAYHARLDRYVAIKVLHPAFKEDGSFAHRFNREAKIVARLEHPNIVGAHWFQYIDQPYTARGSSDDGENYQIGFVDGCDTPYPELIKASREVNWDLYKYRFNHKKERKKLPRGKRKKGLRLRPYR